MEKEFYNGLTQNRKNFVEQISYLIVNELNNMKEIGGYNGDETVNTLAIDAGFGMGKTYFSKGLRYYLKNEASKGSNLKSLDVIEYNAWESDFFQDPMKTILYRILSSVDNDAKVEMELGKTARKVFETCSEAVDSALKVSIFKVLNVLKNADKIDSLEEYQEYLNLIKVTKEVLEEKAILFGKSYRPKVIIIDELDRCKPNFAIEVLEAVKHFFNIRGLFFVFLVNRDQLTNSAENLFGNFCGQESYFQKFFDLEFKLPELDFQEYIEKEYARHREKSSYLKEVDDGYEVDIAVFSEALFLHFYKNLEHLLNGSVREFKKKFSKFKMLMKTLRSKEKEDFTLLITLTLFYLNKEFSRKEFSNYIENVRKCFEKESSQGWDSHIYYGKQINMFDEGVLTLEIDKWYRQIYFRLMENYTFTARNEYMIEYTRKVGVYPVTEKMKGQGTEVGFLVGKSKNLKYYHDNNINIAVCLDVKGSDQNGSLDLAEWCEKKYTFLEALYEHE